MIEFGSDFHAVDDYYVNISNFVKFFQEPVFYGSGRQAIIDICIQNKYKKLWIPQYFCYEVIASIRNSGVEVVFYDDFPGGDDIDAISKINFSQGDVLLRMNYFGLRDFRSNTNISIPVIEDHSHALLSSWSLKSNADWCVASLRKTLPIATGGMLWSPLGFNLRKFPISNEQVNFLSTVRTRAMELKKAYLAGEDIDKNIFLNDFRRTENMFNDLPICVIGECDGEVLQHFDFEKWNTQKLSNWKVLQKLKLKHATILQPENEDFCSPFSYALLFDSSEERDIAKELLICNNIYPAILWNVPKNTSSTVQNISSRILSIHCDGRYNSQEIELLISKLESILNK